jgi:uncharacterized damage-inducible protein DinB
MTPDPVGPNVELLDQLAALVARLSDAQYAHVERRLTGASIGAHVRHILDHYRLFLAGLPAGAVDYDARERDTAVERERGAALAQAAALAAGLRAVSPAQFARLLHVHQQGAHEAGRFEHVESRVDRELLFLQSHTVHHHALIALLAKLQGVEPPQHFGVAPSTIAWLERRAAGSLAAS